MISNIPVKNLQEPYSNGLAYITQKFANPDSKYPLGVHNGIDIGSKEAEPTPIKAILGGLVKVARWDQDNNINPKGELGYGQMVRIWTPTDFGFIEYLYAHLGWFAYDGDQLQCDGIKVVEDQQVARGDVIGTMGSTGFSTGKHLHLGKRLRDKAGNIITPAGTIANNGGYIDPFNDLFLDDMKPRIRFVFKGTAYGVMDGLFVPLGKPEPSVALGGQLANNPELTQAEFDKLVKPFLVEPGSTTVTKP